MYKLNVINIVVDLRWLLKCQRSIPLYNNFYQSDNNKTYNNSQAVVLFILISSVLTNLVDHYGISVSQMTTDIFQL